MKRSKLSLLTVGIIKENPVLVLVLGCCPTLAVSTMAINGVGMGLATTFVLTGSNIAISLLKHVIPDKVRIPCYIVIIATFTTVIQQIVKAYAPAIDQALGIFLPLIVVNCIVFARAELFAFRSSVFDSALDGIGMGLGFTLALVIMSSIREILGSGTWFGITLTADLIDPMTIMMLAPGGFFVFGVMIAALNYFTKGKAVKRKSFGCEGCPSAAACGHLRKEEVK